MHSQNYAARERGKQPDARRQWQGAVNRASGEAFERMIIAGCEAYRLEHRALIEKTPEPMRVLRDVGCGKYLACFTKAAQPDFKGTIAGGRAVCFEAKHSDSGRIEQRAVTSDQADALNTHLELGAACFVIVSICFQDFYRVPWRFWTNMKVMCGHKYMDREDLEPFRIQPDGKGTLRFLGEVPKCG